MQTLDLSWNDICEAGAKALPLGLQNLQTLNLSGNPIGDAGDFVSFIGEAGANALAESATLQEPADTESFVEFHW